MLVSIKNVNFELIYWLNGNKIDVMYMWDVHQCWDRLDLLMSHSSAELFKRYEKGINWGAFIAWGEGTVNCL